MPLPRNNLDYHLRPLTFRCILSSINLAPILVPAFVLVCVAWSLWMDIVAFIWPLWFITATMVLILLWEWQNARINALTKELQRVSRYIEYPEFPFDLIDVPHPIQNAYANLLIANKTLCRNLERLCKQHQVIDISFWNLGYARINNKLALLDSELDITGYVNGLTTHDMLIRHLKKAMKAASSRQTALRHKPHER